MDALSFGFGRQRVAGLGAGWLIEASVATAAERMCSLSGDEAARWVELAQLEVPAQVQRGLRDREVLVLVERAPLPIFDATPPMVDLVDLVPRDEAPIEEAQAAATDFIEVQVVDARGRPRPSVAYRLCFPDGTERSGMTDADGLLRHDRLSCTGDCVLVLPEVEAA